MVTLKKQKCRFTPHSKGRKRQDPFYFFLAKHDVNPHLQNYVVLWGSGRCYYYHFYSSSVHDETLTTLKVHHRAVSEYKILISDGYYVVQTTVQSVSVDPAKRSNSASCFVSLKQIGLATFAFANN